MSDTEENALAECEQVISTSEDDSLDSTTERKNPSSKRKLGTGGPKRDVDKNDGEADTPDRDFSQRRVKGESKTRTPKPGLKLAFRRLPPTLKSDEFLEVLGQIPEYNYYYYKPAERYRGQLGFSTAFINFVDKDDGLIMEEKFNNYMVVDIKGSEYYISVAVALNQSIPKPAREDPLMGTYKDSERFKAFLERYNQVDVGVLGVILNEEGTITTDLMLREIEEKKDRHKHDLESTPLIEFIRDKTVEDKKRRKQIREEEAAKAREKLKINKQTTPTPVYKILSKSYDRDHVQFASNNKPGSDFASASNNAYSNPSQTPPGRNPNQQRQSHNQTPNQQAQSQTQDPSFGNSGRPQDKRNKERERKEKKEKDRRERRAKDREQRLAARAENKKKDSGDKKFENRKPDGESKVEKEDTLSSTEKLEKDTKTPASASASEKPDRSKPYADSKKDKYSDSKPKTDGHPRAGRRERDRGGRDYPKEAETHTQRRSGIFKDRDRDSENPGRKHEDDSGRRNYRDRGNRQERENTSKKSSDTGETTASKKPEGESKSEVHSSTEKVPAVPGSSKQGSGSAEPHQDPKPKDSGGDSEKPELKKRIVKKIIRVKKVKGSEIPEEGKEFLPSGESSKPVIVKKVIKKSSSGSSEPKGSDSKPSVEKDKDTLKQNVASTSSQGRAAGDEAGASSDANKNKEKKRRGRPDLQIYQPGGLRRGENGGGAGPSSAGSNSEKQTRPKTEKERERDRERAHNKSRGYGYGGKPLPAAGSSARPATEPSEKPVPEKPTE